MSDLPSYAIGASASALVSLESLGVPIPKADAVDYAEYVETGAGTVSGQGWLAARWRFASLTTTQQAALAAYAGTCGVRTLLENGSYATYSALMVLPPKKSAKVGQLFDYVVEFRKMVAV